jgi:iron complex outermembrane receptor protein|tara:strand:- start:8265 stop:10325 length:2061 start_codon:yes stop_codon:yes gene_type:complete
MNIILTSALSLMSLLCFASFSYAEDITFDDMTVTATRSERSSLELPASIDIKSASEVEVDKASTQRELLNSIAGVRLTQTGSTVGHTTSIRLPQSTNPYYLFLQDSIPIQSSGFFNHNGLAYTNFSSAGAVEVFKGAGTALYGSDAVGGIINVRSSNPMDNLGTKLSAESGRDDFQRFEIGTAIEIDEHAAISANISHAKSDVWREHSKYERDELSINYVNDLNDENQLKIGLSINSSESEMTSAINGFRRYRDEPSYIGQNVERTISAGVEPIRKFDYSRLNFELNHIVSDMLEVNTIAYIRNNRNRYNATWEANAPSNDSEENSYGLLLKADIDTGRVQTITGLDVEYTQASTEFEQGFDYTPSGWGSTVAAGKIYDYEVDYKAIAPYIRVELAITPKIKLGAGLRYDINSFEYTNKLTDGQYAASTYSRASSDIDPTFNHLSPKLDLTYQISSQQSVYGRYANGFRVPQASRLYSLRTNNIDFSLDEEVTDTFEVGYKYRKGGHEFTTAIYSLVIDDTIVRRENAFGERYFVNGSKTLHRGLEFSLASKLSDEVTTKLAYSFSQHEFDGDDVYGDNEQQQAPENTANARLIYTPNQLSGLTTMFEWEHVGSYWLDDANTARYAGHDVGNIKMRYRLDKNFTIFARVNNITDRLYAESAELAYGSERYTPAPPRQAFVGFEYKL